MTKRRLTMFVIPGASELEQLSPKDEKKPYSEFYYRGAVKPAEKTLEKIQFGKPIPEDHALKPDEVDRMLQGGYLEAESGYCIFDDGIGYASAHTLMPDVTDDMNSWWGPWHERDDLRYKLWCPGSHIRVGSCWAQENIGVGVEDLFFTGRLNPALFGFNTDQVEKRDDIAVIRGANVLSKSTPSNPEDRPLPGVVMHFVRKLPQKGVEYRSRFWLGMHFVQGKPVRMISDEMKISAEKAYGLAYHCAYEMATLGSILPELHGQFRNMP